jgi:acyl carrier protein
VIYLIDKIEKIIKDNVEIDDLKITPSTSFKDDLGLDSFEMAQILCNVEDELKIDIDNTDITQILTVSDLLNCIENA